MELYFNVLSLEKGKCLFEFSYYKTFQTCVRGSVAAELGSDPENARFDEESERLLVNDDKNYIVRTVVKNLIA